MLELDAFLGDIHNDIVDIEQSVLRQVSSTRCKRSTD